MGMPQVDTRQLRSFSDAHRGRSIVVCGCGTSLATLRNPERFITIGVNDVGRLFHPDYLVVVDPPERFKGDRFEYVRSSRARYLFTQLADLDVPHPNIVLSALGEKDGCDFSNPDVLHYSVVTPYIALCLAIHMGATDIGLVGVDFTDNHFFGPTGVHEWTPHVAAVDRQFGRLGRAALARGVRVFNLSRASRLESMPHLSLEAFAALDDRPPADPAARPLSIVSYATTPVAGVPATLARCINATTPHRAHCVWAGNSYGNGISFEGDVDWTASPALAATELDNADLVIVHNGKVADAHRDIIARKPAIVMAHNYIWNVDQALVTRGFPGVVVGQYQATLPEFGGWHVVPNPMEPCQDAALDKGDVVIIAYTPADQNGTYPRGHRLYWHSKGYPETIAILNRLAARHDIRLEVVPGGFASHAESMAMKRRAHIVIDECVTGSYHRNSLEGLAAGAVVVNGVGLLEGVQAAFHHCAIDAPDCPFIHASLATLENVLETLIALGADMLAQLGRQNRGWLERHWDFGRQWQHFWRPAADHAIARAPRRAAATVSDTRLSVIIVSHNEGDLLRRTVASLRASLPEDGEIIVVDDHSSDDSMNFLAAQPGPVRLVRPPTRLGSAKARNYGARFACGRLVLFSDAHVAAPPGWDAKLVSALADPDVGAVGPAIRVMRYPADYDIDTSETSAEARGYGMRWHGADLNVSWLPKKSAEPFAVPLLGGAFLVMRRNLFAAIGGFEDELSIWGSEDAELSLRLWLLGYKCLVVPEVDVAHRFRTTDAAFPADWESIIYNKLFLAAMHFSEARQSLLHDAYRMHPAFPAAIRRLERSGAASRSKAAREARPYDDQVFFDRFRKEQPDPLASQAVQPRWNSVA